MRPRTEQEMGGVPGRLCRVVKEQPGIHFRGLARAANLSSVGQLRHHLDRLVGQGILIELEDGGYHRFFLSGEHDPRLRPALALFARRVPRRLGQQLLLRSMSRTELRRALGCADSTLGFHLARMEKLGFLTKRDCRCCRYTLADPELVRSVLRMRDGGGTGTEEDPVPPLRPSPGPEGHGAEPPHAQRPPSPAPGPHPAFPPTPMHQHGLVKPAATASARGRDDAEGA